MQILCINIHSTPLPVSDFLESIKQLASFSDKNSVYFCDKNSEYFGDKNSEYFSDKNSEYLSIWLVLKL